MSHPGEATVDEALTACRRRLAQLKGSENRYRTIFENTGTATLLIDADTTIAAINTRFAQLLGYAKEEIEGRKSWTEFIHPDDLERMKGYHHLRRKNPRNAPTTYAFRLKNRSGEFRQVVITIDMIPGSDQSVASLLDISERIKAEKALCQSEERYRLLVETMNEGIIILDRERRVRYVNSRACDIIGHPMETLLGHPGRRFVAPESQAVWDDQMVQRRKGVALPYEITWETRTGAHTLCRVSPRVRYNDSGQFDGSFAVLTDITAIRRSQQALRLSEELFSKAFRATPSSILIATLNEGRVVNVNDSFLAATGCDLLEVVGKPVQTIGLFPNTDGFRRLIRDLDRRRRIRAYSLPFLTKSGERRMGVWSAEIVDIWGEACVLAAMADVTETRRLQRELLAASEKERQRIGRDLHDDLCPHLIGIEVLASVLAQRLAATAPEAVAPVSQIRELIQKAIDKTRSLSRGLCPQPPQEQPLTALLEDLALETQQLFGCTCHYKTRMAAAALTAEQANSAEQALSNERVLSAERVLSKERVANCYYVAREALQNAVRHGKADRIEMGLVHQGDRIILTVRDNGRGFDATNNGHGLGLRSMDHRARLLDGELKVISRLGGGTRVRLTIPCE
jgi:PAS domain S-box-containing protein